MAAKPHLFSIVFGQADPPFGSDNGVLTFCSALFSNRRDRVSLFVRRSRWRIRLHRYHDAVRYRAADHSPLSFGPEHFSRDHRLVPILAGWTFFMEIVLAIRAAFDSGGLPRRLRATFSGSPANLDRDRSVVLGI